MDFFGLNFFVCKSGTMISNLWSFVILNSVMHVYCSVPSRLQALLKDRLGHIKILKSLLEQVVIHELCSAKPQFGLPIRAPEKNC